MPDFGRTPDNIAGDEPSFDDIRRSDSFIDALAAGGPVAPQDQSDAALAALLGGWRDEMRWPPATGLITEQQAVTALNAGLAEKPARTVRERREPRRETASTPAPSRRGLSLVGAAAAAVLCIGGFGAVVAGAGPGDALYGLRSMLFGAPKEVRDDQVALAARTELNQVQELIAQGDWQQAQEKLVSVSTQVAAIGDEQQKQDLLQEFNDLSAKVVERDPEATAAPGIIYTVPPSATELVPAVAPPTSTPSAPPASDSSTGATTSGSETSASETSGSAASTTATTTTSGAPAATTTPTSASAPASTSAPTSASTSASPSTSRSTPATTATSTPTSAAPVTTSASPAQASTTTAATTSVAPKSAAPTTTTANPSPAQATTTQAPAQAETTTAPASTPTATPTEAEAEESAPETTTAVPAPVTTTTVVPAG